MEFIPSQLPIETKCPKLVRDNIPDIIFSKTGKHIEQKILEDDGEYLQALLTKLVEESVEAHHSLEKGNLEEELADVMEIVESVMKLQNLQLSDLLAVQNEKRKKNGGFGKRILMIKNVHS